MSYSTFSRFELNLIGASELIRNEWYAYEAQYERDEMQLKSYTSPWYRQRHKRQYQRHTQQRTSLHILASDHSYQGKLNNKFIDGINNQRRRAPSHVIVHRGTAPPRVEQRYTQMQVSAFLKRSVSVQKRMLRAFTSSWPSSLQNRSVSESASGTWSRNNWQHEKRIRCGRCRYTSWMIWKSWYELLLPKK